MSLRPFGGVRVLLRSTRDDGLRDLHSGVRPLPFSEFEPREDVRRWKSQLWMGA